MRASLLFLCLVAVALSGDFGLIGLKTPEAGKLLTLLIEGKHRVAAFDATDEALGKAFMRRGAISSFSEAAVVKFATPVVVVLDGRDLKTLWNELDVKGKVFVVWGRPKDAAEIKELEDAASISGCSVAWGVFDADGGGAITGKEFVMQIPGVKRLQNILENSGAVDVSDDQVLNRRRFEPCPEQKAGPSLVVRRFSAQEMGCENTHLTVCRLYAKLVAPDHRLHVVAVYDTTGDIATDDPDGFFHAFNATIQPMEQEVIELIPNGACDTYITMGTDHAATCAMPDPKFDRDAFLKEGRIVKGTGWFCGNPVTGDTVPKTAPKPPNRDDAILIAQFTVRQPYSVSGEAMIISAGPNRETVKTLQRFNCDCDYDEQNK